MLQVTPDPGVIEVNIHPAHELGRAGRPHRRSSTRRRARRASSTEKFMLDGRHTGTGGGNHVVLGGATPADSPFLRRPDLLRSLLAYWQNHPSLSLPVLGHVHRPDQPGAARRRGAQRPALRAGDRVRRTAPPSRDARREHAALAGRPHCCATCWSTSPATRTAPSSASTSSTRPTARPAASACSSCAPSRCRRMRA